MPFCRSCGSEVADDAKFCVSCGAPVDAPVAPAATPVASPPVTQPATAPAPLSGAWIAGQVAILVGSVLLIAGPLMSWMSAIFISVSGLEKTDNEALIILVLGAVGTIVALTSFLMKRSFLSWIPWVVGVLALGFSIYYYIALLDNLDDVNDGLFTASLGAGIYVCLAASVLVLIGATASVLGRRRG